MRVIVWGINYAPEITGIAPHNVALCEFLRERGGDDVEMVTTFAYYPAWRKSAEDRHQLFRTDVINGVPVHRCWHFVPARVSAWKRIIHEATFVFTSTLRMLSLKRPDVYVIASPPLLLGMAAWLVSRIKGAPFVFHVQDLQPDAAVGLGMLRAGWFTRALYWLEAFAYKHATRVSGISEEILDAFRRKGVPEEKLILFPNAIALPADNEIPRAESSAQNMVLGTTSSSPFTPAIWESNKASTSCSMPPNCSAPPRTSGSSSPATAPRAKLCRTTRAGAISPTSRCCRCSSAKTTKSCSSMPTFP